MNNCQNKYTSLFSSEVEHCICNAMVVGSNPTKGFLADVAQW